MTSHIFWDCLTMLYDNASMQLGIHDVVTITSPYIHMTLFMNSPKSASNFWSRTFYSLLLTRTPECKTSHWLGCGLSHRICVGRGERIKETKKKRERKKFWTSFFSAAQRFLLRRPLGQWFSTGGSRHTFGSRTLTLRLPNLVF